MAWLTLSAPASGEPIRGEAEKVAGKKAERTELRLDVTRPASTAGPFLLAASPRGADMRPFL